MGTSTLNYRAHALGFAERTRKNLLHIEDSFASNADVHVVTQVVNSLLGLIVFPREKAFDEHIRDLTLQDLEGRGWPAWEILHGKSDTLGSLVRHLRNAVAHGRMLFLSESRDITEVTIEVQDGTIKGGEFRLEWHARIGAKELRAFCLKYIDSIENALG